MCDRACVQFGSSHLSRDEVIKKTVIEVGSLDVNGSLRAVVENLEPMSYLGVDIVAGPDVDEIYTQAECIVLVMDNLNTHKKASLYEAFELAEAKRIADKLEIHYTPKHGSWLNMAEIEISVLSRQCLSERMDNMKRLEREAMAWTQERNAKEAKVDWRFMTEDARIKLKKLYPSIE